MKKSIFSLLTLFIVCQVLLPLRAYSQDYNGGVPTFTEDTCKGEYVSLHQFNKMVHHYLCIYDSLFSRIPDLKKDSLLIRASFIKEDVKNVVKILSTITGYRNGIAFFPVRKKKWELYIHRECLFDSLAYNHFLVKYSDFVFTMADQCKVSNSWIWDSPHVYFPEFDIYLLRYSRSEWPRNRCSYFRIEEWENPQFKFSDH